MNNKKRDVKALEDSLNRETLARWKEVEQGNVVSHQAVSEWLDTWGTDQESDRPPSLLFK